MNIRTHMKRNSFDGLLDSFIEVKVILFLYLINYHAMKTYGRM
jgi:hypothetical protein